MRIRCSYIPFLVAACLLFTTSFAFSQSTAKSAETDLQRQAEAAGVAPTAPRATGTDTYVVKQGDSLYSIARAHRTSVASLKAANSLRTSRLKIGQMLRLAPANEAMARRPEKPPSAMIPDAAEETASRSILEEEPAADVAPNVPVASDTVDQPASSTGEVPESQAGLDGQPLRMQLASTGIGMLGVRYRWNGNSEQRGFDCSGLVKSLFEKFNISLPRSSREQFKTGEKVERDKLEIGDLVFFSSRGRTPSHVGIYIGDNQFLHAARKARRVVISNLTDRWYTKRFLGARRLLDLWAEEPPAPASSKPN
jgi:cell wall-associated NlpC family hydrolase